MIQVNKIKHIIPFLFLLLTYCGPEAPISPEETISEKVIILKDPSINYHTTLKQLHLQVRVDGSASLREIAVFSHVFRPDLDSIWLSTQLFDHGEMGDQIAGDEYYGITLASPLPDTLMGNLVAYFWAKDNADIFSDTLSAFYSLTANKPPRILNVWAPDSISLPDYGQTDTLIVEVEVEDPDGLQDIVAVFFEVRSIDDTTQWNSSSSYILNDAGIGADKMSGDGIFSTFLVISWENRLADNIFRYFAVDHSDNYSPYFLDTITVYKDYIPEILNFIIASSSQITRPTPGSESDSLFFYIQVYDGNGIDDIQVVTLRRRNPNGTYFEQRHPPAYDDGLHQDFSAKDGWYTIASGFSPEDALGTYFYRSLVVDKLGNRVLSADSLQVTLVSE